MVISANQNLRNGGSVTRNPNPPTTAPVKVSDQIPTINGAVSLGDMLPDERAGSLAELVGYTILIHSIERFTSATYNQNGARLQLQLIEGDTVTEPVMTFTTMSQQVMRIVDRLMDDPHATYRHLERPIQCSVIQVGKGYGLR